MYVCMYACMYVCMYVRTYVRTYVCMYVCVYVCMCVCVYDLFRYMQMYADIFGRYTLHIDGISWTGVMKVLPLSFSGSKAVWVQAARNQSRSPPP